MTVRLLHLQVIMMPSAASMSTCFHQFLGNNQIMGVSIDTKLNCTLKTYTPMATVHDDRVCGMITTY